MPNRPTREFKTSGDHTLVLNEYITGAENWQIRQVYARGMKSTDANASDTSFEAELKALGLVVISLDGATEDVASKVMALPISDYREVIAEVTPIVEGKKKSETS